MLLNVVVKEYCFCMYCHWEYILPFGPGCVTWGPPHEGLPWGVLLAGHLSVRGYCCLEGDLTEVTGSGDSNRDSILTSDSCPHVTLW